MRIATWNVDRLQRKVLLPEVLQVCQQIRGDILVLTETNQQLSLSYRYAFHSPALADKEPLLYRPAENRVSIFTNYPCIRQYSVSDPDTSLCLELQTEKGSLLVYGTIIGKYGNRHASFLQQLEQQTADIRRLASGKNLCICGDFNCSFGDSYYYTKLGRQAILKTLAETRLQLLTKNQPECIDHIALSKQFLGDETIQIHEWNQNKRLSDHKAIAVTLGEPSLDYQA